MADTRNQGCRIYAWLTGEQREGPRINICAVFMFSSTKWVGPLGRSSSHYFCNLLLFEYIIKAVSTESAFVYLAWQDHDLLRCSRCGTHQHYEAYSLNLKVLSPAYLAKVQCKCKQRANSIARIPFRPFCLMFPMFPMGLF